MAIGQSLLFLGLTPSIYNSILDFLINQPQTIRLGKHTSFILTDVPQDCVLRPLFNALLTHDCQPLAQSYC